MSRYKAALIHLTISASVVLTILSIAFWIWYPGPTFKIAGAVDVVAVLVGVDLVLGPALTLIVFKEGKPGLKMDLSIIAFIQLAALAYGSHTLYTERPYYLVFVVDRFNLVPEKYIDKSEIRYDELRHKPFADVIRVFARLPQDPDEFQRYMESIMFESRPDLEGRPEYWEPYAAGKQEIRSKIKPLETLQAESAEQRKAIEALAARYRPEHPNLGVIPIYSSTRDIAMLMDIDTEAPLDMIEVNAW
jgi:hypothetical protein